MVKVTATRGFGANVVLHGANYDEAYAEARRRCDADGSTFIHPFDDVDVIAGQGTIGLELLEQVDGLEAVVVPIGGGGLDRRHRFARSSRCGLRCASLACRQSRLPSMQAGA